MGRPQQRYPRLLLTLVFALASCLVLGQDGAQPQKDQAGQDGGARPPQGQAKSFQPPPKKPARNYASVDPSFTANLEGSMTGGQAQIDAESRLAADAHGRLESLLRDTKTDECRKEIIDAFQGYMGAQALERSIPFEGQKFTSQCVDANKRPEIPESGLLDPEEVQLAYVLLAHEEPAQVVRLVNALDDTPDKGRTWFIIHIDAKAEDVQQELVEVFKDRPNIIMMDKGRVDVAWGGFNVVQATLNAVALAMERKIPFHWLWILSGTTYPIASNDSIRAKLASHHPESIFMESKVAVHKPASTTWHYFVECDSALHRIGRNLHPRGLDMYVGSQWLAMPPSAARWLMEDRQLVPRYAEYARHIVVADENFLPTMFKNSPMCGHQVTSNLVHVQFDKYEHTLDVEDRRLDKCLMPNPDHCGRSPATMTLDYLSVLEHSGMLFARKFDPQDTELFDVLDRIRNGEQPWRQGPTFRFVAIRSAPPASAEASTEGGGGGQEEEEELCLVLEDPVRMEKGKRGTTKPEAKMVSCSKADPRQVFKLGPCSSDGHLELGEGGKGFMQSTRGNVSGRAPSCSVSSSRGTCLDLLGEAKGPGAPAISYKCHNRWNQFFSFGEGELAGHLISTVPSHLAMADDVAGAGTVCLEVMKDSEKGTVVKTAACSTESTTQKFSVVQLHAKDDQAAKEPPITDGNPESGEGCTGPEGTCPAK